MRLGFVRAWDDDIVRDGAIDDGYNTGIYAGTG